MTLEHPRSVVWGCLTTPAWYPRFFRGIGCCDQAGDQGDRRAHRAEGQAEFTVRLGSGKAELVHRRIRCVATRPHESMTFEGLDFGSLVSLRLVDLGSDRTRVVVTFFKPALVHPALTRAASDTFTGWARDGLQRVDDYLSGRGTAEITNIGGYRSVQISVAKTLVQTGVVRTYRPDHGLRQIAMLAKWGFTLAGGFAAAAAKAPKQIALADDDGMRTFSEVHDHSNRLAAGLVANGLSPGGVVAIMARNHIRLVECMVACGKLGVDLVLLNTGLGRLQIEDMLDRHDPELVFVDAEFESVLRYLAPDLPQISTTGRGAGPDATSVDGLVAGGQPELDRPAQPGRLVVLTSGTSGSPKSANRPTPKGFGSVAAILSRMPLQMGETMLIAAPLFHSWGLGMLQISTPMRATVVLQTRFDAEACLRAVAARRCTVLVVVPIMLQRILDLPAEVRARYDTSSLRVVASSGSPIPGSTVIAFMDAFGDVLYNFYGSTEVSWASIADPADLRAAPTTAGKPPLGTTVAIIDMHGATVPVGALGRIFVGNDMLFDGYADADSPQIEDTLMDTGDLGYLDADGRLFVAGRDDEMIISGGENVFPRPVEEALAYLPQIREVAVVGVPDSEYGQRLAAFIVTRAGARIDQEMVRSYIRHRLSRYSVPRDVNFVRSLPRGATGKIVKRLLVSGEPERI